MDEIVVGIDGSDGSVRALRWAAAEAPRRDARVVALMAWGSLDPGLVGFTDTPGEAEASASVAEVVELAGLGEDDVTVRTACQQPAAALAEASRDAALVVIGSRGLGGFSGLLLGSVGDQCLRLSECPLVVVPPANPIAPASTTNRIVVGVDRSESARQALAWAVDEAHRRKATVEVVHAWQPPFVGWQPVGEVPDDAKGSARQLLDDVLATAPGGAKLESHLACANATDAVVQAARRADLVVVGGRAVDGARLGVGSVARPVVHHSPVPVVLVPER